MSEESGGKKEKQLEKRESGITAVDLGFDVGGFEAREGAVAYSKVDSERSGSETIGTSAARMPVETEAESIFRIAILSELGANPDYSTAAPPEARLHPVDISSFDSLFRTISPSLAIDVEDPFERSSGPIRVDLRWTDWKSLRPASIVEQVQPLRCLIDARRILKRLEGKQLKLVEARDQLSRVLGRENWIQAVFAALPESQFKPEPLLRSIGSSSSAATSSRGPKDSGQGERDAVDSLFDMVAFPGQQDSEPDAEAESERSSSSKGFPQSAAPITQAPATARTLVESAFCRFLSNILGHKEVRRLEASWRALRFLLQNSNKHRVEIKVLPVGPSEVDSALERLANSSIASTEHEHIDLLLVDTSISALSPDLKQLERWAARAQALGAPLLLGGDASLIGLDGVDKLQRGNRRFSASEDPRAIAARSVSALDASRWLGIVLNRVLVRAPYDEASSRIPEMPFSEEKGGNKVFACGAYFVAALIARSFDQFGHPFFITGPQHGAIAGFEVHTLGEQGVEYAIPTETFASLDAQAEAARAGVIVLGAAPNRDSVILAKAPMFYRGPGASRGADPAAPVSLVDQLAVSRLAFAIESVAASLPSNADTKAISEIVAIIVASIFEKALARPPETRVQVDRIAGRLNATVKFHGEPLFGLDEISFAARL